MSGIKQRLDSLEQKIEDIQRQKSHIPVLIVREQSKDMYSHAGAVLNGQTGVKKYAKEHGATTIIIDNIPRKETI